MKLEITNRQLEIIAAAGKILSNTGISGLTIKSLAKEMKFSESAIYRHFASKEKIIITMLEYLAANMEQRYSHAVEGGESPEEKFILLFNNQFSFFETNPHFVVAVFADGLMKESKTINDCILNIMRIKTKHLLPIILEGQKTGVFTTQVSTDKLIHIIIGAFRLQMFRWQVDNFQSDIKQKGNSMINALLSLIKN